MRYRGIYYCPKGGNIFKVSSHPFVATKDIQVRHLELMTGLAFKGGGGMYLPKEWMMDYLREDVLGYRSRTRSIR